MDTLIIKFLKTKSGNFNAVLNSCNQFAQFHRCEEWYILRTNFVECMQLFEFYYHIVTHAQRWTSFRYQVNNNLINHKSDFNGLYFYPLQAISNCIKEKQRHEHEEYCTDGNGWGCMRLTGINLVPTYYSENNWFDYGYLRNGEWIIDKVLLLKEIKREAKLKLIDNCPHFDFNRILEVVNALPDRIDIANKNWKFKTSMIFDHKTKEFINKIDGLKWIGDIENFSI
jgi:hypothetical protein